MNRVVLITGASRGIGKAVALHCLDNGHAVIGISRKNPDFSHPQFTWKGRDLSDVKTLPLFIKELLSQFPKIDTFIGNAGQPLFGHLEELGWGKIEEIFALNFLANVALAKSLLPHFKTRKRGQFLFIGSEAALEGKRQGSIYCASKAALRSFAQALRQECGSSGIPVTLVHPGMVDTDFFVEQSFRPGERIGEFLIVDDVVAVVAQVLAMREGVVLEEILIRPQSHVVRRI